MIGLFIGAIYMIIADKYSTKVKHPQTVDQLIISKHLSLVFLKQLQCGLVSVDADRQFLLGY